MKQSATRPPFVGIVLASAALASACTTGQPADGRPVAPTATSATPETTAAVDLLKAGTAFIDQVSFVSRVVIGEGQILAESRVDNANKRAVSGMSSADHFVEIRVVGEVIYMLALTLPEASDGWMILDPAKVPASFAPGLDRGQYDPGGSERLIDAIVSAQVSGAEVSGTIDVVKLGTGSGISFIPFLDSTSPENVRSQEFRATLDSQGRLEEFFIPGSQGLPSAGLEYVDFGGAVAVSPPRGAQPAPEALYPRLGQR